MSMISTLYTGSAGMTAHSDAIAVVGDNVANASTIGFKGSRAVFEDILARSVGSGQGQGIGSRVSGVQTLVTQGALLGTGVATDLAISGDGYFVVRGSQDGTAGNFYTRAGQFQLNNEGTLVNPQGMAVQGYVADADGNLVQTVADVQVSTAPLPPKATGKIELGGNLDQSAEPPTAPFDVTDPEATSNFSSSVTVYDSRGEGHTVNVHFAKTDSGDWTWHALVDGGEVGGTAGEWQEAASGTLAFDSQGRLQTQTTDASSFAFTDADTATPEFSFGDAIDDSGTGLKGISAYAASSSINKLEQDGNSSATLTGISVGSDGAVTGVYSNGLKRTVAQVLLADFQSPQELARVGSNLLAETVGSGEAMIGEAKLGGRGAINAGTLEQSNVDIAREFIDMIAFQRGFQANSRSITTADQMLQETLSIKR